jgi:SAM-dependent methyltransferase
LLRSWLAHPLTRGRELDSAETTVLRRRIIREKPFLRRLYDDWYGILAAAIPPGPGAVVELGAGAGFLAERVPELIATDIQLLPDLDLVADAGRLPFAEGRVRALLMTNVLHHLADPAGFLAEAARCVRSGGVLAAVEPWVSAWSKLVYRRLHHERFDPETPDWHVEPGGPLSAANGAMPWILLERDAERFRRELPQWSTERVRPLMPLRYLVSGGVSMRGLAPGWSYPAWRMAERLLQPAMGSLAMFAEIVLRRTDGPAEPG